ncbi:hypothetical protein QRC94_003645 [Vibrio vulnificus]|nr:hypothetical protein [Vibrio vulnificus]EJC6821039.1 hypothetical protein [Vibrio vulnificus]EJC6954860.1 hypothetical protein [Vibrio vulnificus]EJC6959620.1 hypothetical protein [Vibrio vulnificus]EKQ3695753.1 hypothetical protein [Vibrio vulnificus]
MDIVKKNIYNLTPVVKGIIFHHGIPAINIEVTLEISALNDTKELKTHTNQNGEFIFESVSISTIKTSSMFDQKMVSTSLTIKRGHEYTYLWRSYLPGYNILTFMSENLSNLICDINSKEKYFIFDGMKKIMTDMKSILSATFMGL